MDPLQRIKEQKEALLKQAQPAEPAPAVSTEPPAEPPAEPTPAPAAEPTAIPAPPAATDDLQTQYNTLQAKYQSEVPRLHSWVQQKDAKIAELENELKELRAKVEATPAPPAAPKLDSEGNPIYVSPYVSDEIRKTDNYLWHVSQIGETAAERHFESLVLAGQMTIKPIEEQIGKVKSETEEEKFNRQLSARCPAWTGLDSGINLDPGFCEWVATAPAPGTGGMMKDLLTNAYMTANLQAMAEIIDLYQTLKPAAPAPPTVPDPASLVAPSRKGGGQQTVIENNQGKVMRMADMERLYDDYRQGKYRGKEPEYQAKKAEFMKAKAEGRLIP